MPTTEASIQNKKVENGNFLLGGGTLSNNSGSPINAASYRSTGVKSKTSKTSDRRKIRKSELTEEEYQRTLQKAREFNHLQQRIKKK